MGATTLSDQRDIRYRKLIDLGIALSSERHHNRLMELILSGAKELTNADGGTLYLHDAENRTLKFVIVLNDTLKIALGGTTGKPITFPPLKLYDAEGNPNHKNIDRKSTRLNSSHAIPSRMPSSA